MFRQHVTMAAVLAVGGVFSWLAASDRMGELFAQQTKTDSQSEGTPKVLPRPDFEYKGRVGKTYKDSDPPQFPQPVKAPKGAPNVVLILLDDSGFGQYSTFGGGVPSPTMDKLAAVGRDILVFIRPPCAAQHGLPFSQASCLPLESYKLL
jgi:arylsulfatase